ncbi:BORC8 protein, partial [Urocolius indicus]|nr:BORC8 protein [Urocolius indicus]
MYVLANEPSVALFRLQEHVRRSLPELAQHKVTSSQPPSFPPSSAIKNMTDSTVYFKSIDSLLRQAIAMKDQLNTAQGRSTVAPQAKNPPGSS